MFPACARNSYSFLKEHLKGGMLPHLTHRTCFLFIYLTDMLADQAEILKSTVYRSMIK